MPKKPSASDLASLRVPTDVRLSPDGRFACFVVKEAAPDLAGYRTALWLVPSDGSLEMRWSALTLPEDAGFIDGEGLAAGFEIRAGPFDPLISTNVIDTMLSTNTSIYLRYHFEVPAGPQFSPSILALTIWHNGLWH